MLVVTRGRCHSLLNHSRLWFMGPGSRGVCHQVRVGATHWLGRDDSVHSQLRLVTRLDIGLRLRLAELGLVVDHLADGRKHRAFDLGVL